MVCKGCGAYLPKGARRCSICGRPVSGSNRRRRRGPGVWTIVAIATLAVLLVALAGWYVSRARAKPEYAQVLDRYFTALEKRDAEAYAQTRPDAYIAYLTREDGGAFLNYTVYVNDLAKAIDERMNGYAAACGSNIRIAYRIDQALDIAPYIPRIDTTLSRWYDFPEDSVEQALLVSGSYTVCGNSASQQYEIGETLLLKIGGDWYFSPDIGQSWRG